MGKIFLLSNFGEIKLLFPSKNVKSRIVNLELAMWQQCAVFFTDTVYFRYA